MKRITKSVLALLLAFLMVFEAGELGIAYAVDEIDKAINPAERIELTVPEKYQTGENLFFIATADWATSERSGEAMYIPIQRVGDLDAEAEVTLKVVDLSAKHDVNYTIEVYKEAVDPEIFFVDKSIKELALEADEQMEVELGDESDLGEIIYENGEAELIDGEGNTVATVTATPLDENGNPIEEETPAEEETLAEEEAPVEEETEAEPEAEPEAELETEAAHVIPGEVTETEWTEPETEPERELSATERLRSARDAYTGTASDRQELAGGSLSDLLTSSNGSTMTEDEYNEAMADAVADNYPGKEYRLHFNSGEEVKFLVIKPLYSEAAEGDAQLFMLLKEPSENYKIGEDVNPVSVTIYDEDEPETVTVSMAAETVYAEDGVAAVTVTRSGRLNAIAGVMLKSWGGSAVEGDEYSGVGAKLWFPMSIQSRTVEIPVWHGTEQKDFYLTITALNDETVETSTTHVVIPAAEKTDGDGELMGIDNVNGHPLTDPINVKAGHMSGNDLYSEYGFDSDTAFHLKTAIDKEENVLYWFDNVSDCGVAYDGIYTHFDATVSWCDAVYRIARWNPNDIVRMHDNTFDSRGEYPDHWLYGAWNSVYAPQNVTIEVENVDNEGTIFNDSYAVMNVDEVRLIKRQFTIKVEDAELKPLIGVDDNEVLANYEAVLLDKSVNSTRTLWTGDSFAINAKDVKSPLRLVGVEVKINQDGKNAWYRVATIDGKSSTVTVEMNAELINTLNNLNCIQWSANGNCDHGGKFYKGTITVRPVFDYIDATVELKNANPDYGSLSAQEPLPNMLWDFGEDRAMDERMGITGFFQNNQIAWSGWNHENHDSYIFEASGNDPYVAVYDHAESVDDIRYLKFAAKNLNGASYLQLFASPKNGWIGPTNIKIPLYQDTEWHEYVVDLTKQPGYSEANWKGALTWFRLDPMDGNTNNGSRILIDYMAFFSSEGSARAYRSGEDGRVTGPATLTYHVGDTLTMSTTVNQAGDSSNMRADGFFYELHTTNAAGVTHNAVDQHYINGSLGVQLSDRNSAGNTVDHPWFNFEPTFTEGGNRIAVIVSDAAYSKLDPTKGLFNEGAEYYTFTAVSGDPKVSVDVSANGSDVRWAKIRVKNVSGADGLRLFTGSGASTVNEASAAFLELDKDTAWHTYIVDLVALNERTAKGESSGWTGNIAWFCLDPMDGNTLNGSKIQIDYMAFFPDEDSAKAYRNDGTGSASMLWDFNKASAPAMGGHVKAGVSYVGAKEDGVEYVSKTHSDGRWVYVLEEDILVNDLYEFNAYTLDSEGAVAQWTLSDGSTFYGDTLYFRSNARTKDNAITLSVYDGGELTYAQLSGTVVSSTMNLSTGRSATDRNPVNGAILTMGLAGAISGETGAFTFPAALTRAGGKVRYLVNYNGVSTIQEATVPGLDAEEVSALSFMGQSVNAIAANLGEVRVDTYSTTGAHFVSVVANQYGILRGGLNALAMNGQELVFIVNVAPGEDYVLNHETYTEHIKEVKLYFLDQYTGDTHGIYSSLMQPADDSPAKWSWNPESGQFVLRIYPFDPMHPTEWDYGDVLMAQLVTDKRGVGLNEGSDMVYDPVSTGFGVFADPDFEPQSFDLEFEDIAEMLQITPGTDEDGDPLYDSGSLEDDDTRYSFGAFPYLGEITAAIHVVKKLVSTTFMSEDAQMMENDLAYLSELKDEVESDGVGEIDFDDLDLGEDIGRGVENSANPNANRSKVWKETPISWSVFFTMTDNFYGGVRFMLGAIFSYGQGNQYERTKSSRNNAQAFYGKHMKTRSQIAEIETDSEEYIFNQASTNKGKDDKSFSSSFGGPYFTISVYFGVYLCYGYVEISTNGGVEKSHEMVFMGAGGFIGFGASVGYTWPFMAGPIPMYINVEGGIKLTFFLGSEADPNMTLQSFKESGEIHGQDFSFNFSYEGRMYVTGTFGVGCCKFFGVRVSVSVGFNTGYNMNVPKWYPQLFDSGCGYSMDATFTGTIDLIFFSLDIYSATWPIPVADGYLYYFQEANRGNKCISYVENGLAKNKGDSEAAKTEARRMADELIGLIDNMSADTELIMAKTRALKNYAYDHDIISWVEKNTIEMNKQAGIAGAVINGVLQDDSDPSGVKFHVNPHVKSEWVAGDGELMSAYSVVKSTPIMEDAIKQPNSKIISIGNNKFLVVFLDDTLSRDTMQAATLKWTVYDASDATWTDPRTVQNDSTADGKPHLADAGDKVILSWASATDEKYEALKETVAAELREALGVEPDDTQIQEALEADPTRAMAILDIFSVEFDKAGESFGAIAQLSDDEYYDDYPQAVYDHETTDYIVLYYKTAQDDEAYDSVGAKLEDLIAAGPDPDKTYSVVSYRLYNGAQEEGDPFGVGWVEGYYPNELPEGWTSEEYLAAYGPERFLASTIVNEDGSYADPPINDLTVAAGLDHLAAFAFTVDKDFDLSTAADRELYVQYYNFNTHGVYYPIRVGGDKTETREIYNTETHDFEKRTFTEQVEVGAPKLVRNGGSTWLFWREDNTSLRYLNVSELLNVKVPAVANPSVDNESDWTYAVRSDGTFATDAMTGKVYVPMVETVNVLSYMTDAELNITDFEFITDDEDNLYVVWTDVVTIEQTDEFGETKYIPAQEIFVSGLMRQEGETQTYTDSEGQVFTNSHTTVRWSKPYRLTRDHAFNDGLALAVDEDGGLIILHNQYTKEVAESYEEMLSLLAAGKIGTTTDGAGNLYAASLEYDSPIRMMVTRCDKVGSLEATKFAFGDDLPVAGQVISVQALIENTGLTDAKGFELAFYECKDGVKGAQIGQTYTSDETIPVNTAKVAKVLWTVPADGPEDYSIMVSVREKNPGGYYDAVETQSDTFESLAHFTAIVTDVTQDGDEFIVDYSVFNNGNRAAPEGCTASLVLMGLYGDLDSDKYGNIQDGTLYTTNVELPAKTTETSTALISTEEGSVEQDVSMVTNSRFHESVRVRIPASVFRFCGYDGVQLLVNDPNGETVAQSGTYYVRLAEPMNLSLNDGKTVSLKAGDAQQLALGFDSNVFLDEGTVLYSVDDPTVASVSADGTVKGLKNGTTTLTATLLPYGSSVTVPVKVSGAATPDTPTVPDTPIPTPTEQPGYAVCDHGEDCLLTAFSDLNSNAWYHDGVHWALENGVMQGVGTDLFAPSETTTRAMLVTMLYRMEGEPETEYDMSFTDVEEGKWYTEAIRWAAANEIVKGYAEETFGPMNELTREQLAAILYRYAQTKGVNVSVGEDTNILSYDDAFDVSDWANAAMCWAVGAGIIQGTGDGALSPKTGATRAQVATMLMRYEAIDK